MRYTKIVEDDNGNPMLVSVGEAYTAEGNRIDFSGLEESILNHVKECSDEKHGG